MMLQQNLPDDFVMGTGESHTVRDFAEAAFHSIGMDIQWKEVALTKSAYQTRVELL